MSSSWTISGCRGNSSELAAPDAAATAVSLGLAVIAIGLPVAAHLVGQAFGLAMCFALALLLSNFAVASLPVVLIFAYVFQNTFVALVSPAIADLDQFNAIRGYNFVLTAAVWIVVAGAHWGQRAKFDPRLQTIISVTTLVLVGIGVYFVAGALIDRNGAIFYLRNIVTPILLFQIFAIVASRTRLSMTGALLVIASAALVFGYIELFANEWLFRLTNGDVYLKWRMTQEIESGAWLKEMQVTGRVYRSYLDAMQVDFLNTPLLGDLGLRFHRMVGPNFHPISFAYALAVFGILLGAIRHWWFALLALPALLVIGSKGALVLLIMVIGALLLSRRLPAPKVFACYVLLLGVYAVGGIAMGLLSQDYHVIGFIGGLNGFLQNPLGHGIGVGGNLSLNMTTIDWGRSQTLGSTDVAVESAIGVLLFQTGIFGVVFIAVLTWISSKLWKLYADTREPALAVAALGLLTVIVNGIFQEEALFSPLALGLILAFCGLLLGRSYRGALPARPA